MTNTVLVTPENWFDLSRLATSSDVAGALELTLTDADGRCPLASVPLDELRAVHHTFGSQRAELAGDNRPASLKAGAYERFLSESRALLRHKAEAVFAPDGPAPSSIPSRLMFPDSGHPVLAESTSALVFLQSFLALSHSPSLLAWAREIATAGDASTRCMTDVWVRILLQKVAVEDEAPEALACLRAVYAGSDSDRHALLSAESRLLEQCDVTGHSRWARSLGLDRSARKESGFDVPGRTAAPAAGTADITVLVPSYCHAEYIEAALESVLAQTYPAYRLLVVDDRSPDGTVDRAARIRDPRLRIEVNDTNLGLGNSVLRALDAIETPYVALLNSDDLFHPERLGRCRDVLERSPQTHVVGTRFAPIDAEGCRLTVVNVNRLFDGRKIADWIQWFSGVERVAEGADLVAELLERNFLITSSNIVCRTEFLRSRADSLRGLKYCFDWQLFLEAAVDRALVYLPEELLGYRLHRSNTVWFDENRHGAYRLEVNRVLARTLRQLQQSSSSRPEAVDRAGLVDLLANHAVKHSDANGFALYLIELLGSRTLEDARDQSKSVRTSLQSMPHPNGTSEGANEGTSREQRQETIATAAWAIADASQEEAAVARAAEQVVREELHRQNVDREQTAVGLRGQIAALETERQHVKVRLQQVEVELSGQIAALEVERRQSEVERRQVEVERQHVEVRLQQVEGDLRGQIAALDASAAVEARTHAEEIARLRSSPEWLVGDRVWNRAGLSRIGGPASRTIRTLRDRRNRWSLALGRAARRIGLTRPRAVVAACWNFPIHSQTFVYQEMQSLTWAGLDCRVFCCGTNPKSELPVAFEKLWDRRVVLQTDWRFNQRDLDHFRRTRPERVDALLARLGESTGLTREALLEQSIVMMGFTFARHVELSGAEYLHTYFFYDQSFLALMAACLLQVPRGVTAYADHMMGDYAFKCVPLHLELADVIVATSQRIKNELSAIGGGRFDSKIIVKPNGIDTARFPYVEAAARLATDGEPELVAVNRIEPKKGLVYLVEAIGVLKARGVAVRLNIVGGADSNMPASADCFRQLTEKISALQLGDRVVLHGVKQQPEFAPIVARSRIFVAPYVEVDSGDKDGIPTAVLEAMSSGLPIVATDAGSLLEVVTDGIEGLSVAQRDPVGLADAIERLLTDRALYVRMSDAARRRAVSEFDAHVTEKRFHERIRACLKAACS